MKIRLCVVRAFLLAVAIHAASSIDVVAQENTAPSASQPAQVEELVRRALDSNRELAAARLEVERARARVRQASLLPNPSLEVEQTGGGLGSSPGELERRATISLPIEYGGKRGRRVDVAEAELLAAEATVADRERLLAAEVRRLYAETRAASLEFTFTDELAGIDRELGRVLQIRVEEGDAAPLDASLLQVEIDRLLSRRAILEGRKHIAELQLKTIAGLPASEPIVVSVEEPTTETAPPLDEAIKLALERRPDLRVAQINVAAAESGTRLATAEALPELALFGSYSEADSGFDDTPVGPLTDHDELFSAGVEISLPIFNRNQGARAEASAVLEQARHLQAFAEQRVRAEVENALTRLHAAQTAVDAFKSGVVERSVANVRTVRAAYEAGAFTISEFLAERRRLVDARRELTDAETERAIATAELDAAIGTPITTSKDDQNVE
jgi:cobalt-zinc-cadmium efflux system outer membrane protein